MKIELSGISKSYGDLKALDNVTLTLNNGIYALLGPNGAGKSTLMNILVSLLKADEGIITLDGISLAKQRNEYLKILGYMPQKQCLYEDFTLKDFLYYVGNLKGMKQKDIIERSAYLMKEVKLEDVFYKKIKTFSGGMKQRAMLAAALINDPLILILDEPTAGLDPMKRTEMQNLIASFAKDKIVLIATHVVSDVEFIANQFLFLKKGKLIYQDNRLNVVSMMETKIIELEVFMEEYAKIKEQYLISSIHYDKDKLIVRIIDVKNELTGLQVTPNISDAYLYLFRDEIHASI